MGAMKATIEQQALGRCDFDFSEVEVGSMGQDVRDDGSGGCVVEIRLSPEQTDEFIARRHEIVAAAARRGVPVASPGWDLFLGDLYSLRRRA
jgi:hypothetical protein